jgi:hypothetical protein
VFHITDSLLIAVSARVEESSSVTAERSIAV